MVFFAPFAILARENIISHKAHEDHQENMANRIFSSMIFFVILVREKIVLANFLTLNPYS